MSYMANAQITRIDRKNTWCVCHSKGPSEVKHPVMDSELKRLIRISYEVNSKSDLQSRRVETDSE